MSDLGELDRPGTPASPGPWDARSQDWLVGDGDDGDGAEVDGTETVVAAADADSTTPRAPEATPARSRPPHPAAPPGTP